MGKNRKATPKNTDLGRSLIRGKNIEKRNNFGQTINKESWLHTSVVNDGYDWNRLNLRSVTEQNTLDEFLETAELAGVEFTAEKLNVKIVGAGTITGVLGDAEKSRIEILQKENMKLITIPRRPHWDKSTSPEQLEISEREVFLNWRRSLALLQEEKGLLLTPYEKNLDIWRQLWRVIERSDVLCQIVDARNPLLFKSDDLESYVTETNSSKQFIVLVNKADYLSAEQRKYWADYFTEQKSKVIFWSALEQTNIKEDDSPENLPDKLGSLRINEQEENTEKEELNADPQSEINVDNKASEIADTKENCSCPKTDDDNCLDYINSADLVSRESLIKIFKSFKKVKPNRRKPYITVGLVGYPNVGKSSTINALLKEKKVAVSATPGKTKHFQTLFLDESLCLCDCPGLVFPTFISTKAEMVLNGILPIDQLRDWVSPSTILAQLIPRIIIENTYGINIQKPQENEDPNRPPTAEEMLSSYARMRGYMTTNGAPDRPRAARYLLKDFVKGKLLYCHPPPNVCLEDYKPCIMSEKVMEKLKIKKEKESRRSQKEINASMVYTNTVDKEFFAEKPIGVHYKPPVGSSHHQLVSGNEKYAIHKPWKKHANKNKREKLRRVYDNQ